MVTHELVVGDVTIPVSEFGVEEIEGDWLAGCEPRRLRITVEDPHLATEDLGDLLEALSVDVPPFAEDAAAPPETLCPAFGGHFWMEPEIQMGHKPERRVCGICEKEQRKIEKWTDVDE